MHGDKYIYHKSVYVKSSEKVAIECKNGHCFPQTPREHKQGHGCKFCGIKLAHDKTKMTLEEFIEEANKVHGEGRYDYSEVEYVNNKTEVWIICHKHDKPYKFPQKPYAHLDGEGCSLCGYMIRYEKQKLTLEEFIEKANEVHGIGRYDYSKVNYVNYTTPVIIICLNHDKPYEFPQTPRDHLSGCGCSLCCSSKGEIAIQNWLIKNKIEFEEQKRFNDCRNIKPLPFDFYLPKYNLYIETKSNNTLPDSLVRYDLNGTAANLTSKVSSTATTSGYTTRYIIVSAASLAGGASTAYNLRTYIMESATTENAANKTWVGKVTMEATVA